MILIYNSNKEPVKVGDRVNIGSEASPEWVQVHYFREPHKQQSQGKVTVKAGGTTHEYYVSIIGAAWINRGNK